MLRYLYMIICFCLACCGAPRKQSTTLVKQQDLEKKTRFTYSNPTVLKGSPYLMILVGVTHFSYSGRYRSKGGYGGGRVVGGSMGGGGGENYYYQDNSLVSYDTSSYNEAFDSLNSDDFYNIVFHNKKTGKEQLFFPEQEQFCDLFLPSEFLYKPVAREDYDEERKVKPPKKRNLRFLLYSLCSVDSNGDGYTNSSDVVLLFRADWSGKNKVQLTPNGTQFQQFSLDPYDPYIYISVKQDSNGDARFTRADQEYILKVNYLRPKMGQTLVNQKTRQLVPKIVTGHKRRDYR
ncbi:MAG: hypothetical protein AAF518_18950 [Spirochaetota bacterium]